MRRCPTSLSNLGCAALAGYLKTPAAEVAADGVTVNLRTGTALGCDGGLVRSW